MFIGVVFSVCILRRVHRTSEVCGMMSFVSLTSWSLSLQKLILPNSTTFFLSPGGLSYTCLTFLLF